LHSEPNNQSRGVAGLRGTSSARENKTLPMDIAGQRGTLALMEVPMAQFARQRVLASREDAVAARGDIELRLSSQADPTAVVLDFEGVRAMTTTFADECIARLLGSRLAGFDEDHPLLVIRATDEVRHTIDTALRARRLLLLALGPNGPEVLGGDELLTQTMTTAFALRRFSVLELAERLNLTPQAANNRLSYLVRAGALARARVIPARGGRQFVYEVPAPIFDESDLNAALASSERRKRQTKGGVDGARRAADA